jgi:transcriptional regulator with XRE-family HTH domain
MPIRSSVRAPRFGEWLAEQRGPQSYEMVAAQMRPLLRSTGLKVDQSMIYKIERGRIPSWPMLAAICQVYHLDFSQTVVVLAYSVEFAGSASLLSAAAAGRPTGALGNTGHARIPVRKIKKELQAIERAFREALEQVSSRLLGSSAAAGRSRRPRKHRQERADRIRSA